MEQLEVNNFTGFIGRANQINLPLNVITDCNNIHLSEKNGVVNKFGNYAKLESGQTVLSGTPMDMYFAKFTINARTLIAFTKTNIYKHASNDFASIKSGLTGADKDVFSYDIAIDDTASPPIEMLVVTNGEDVIQKWDIANSPSAMANLGGSPVKAKRLLWWNRRLFTFFTIESAIEFPYRVRWSAVGDPEDHDTVSSTAGRLDLDLNDGEVIIDAKPFRGTLAILCSKSIVLLSFVGGSNIVAQKRFATNFGCIAANSSVVAESILFYMSLNGIVAFDGSRIKLITANIWDMKDVDSEEIVTCNVGLIKEFNSLIFAYSTPGITTHDKNIVFDFLQNKATFSDMPMAGYAIFNLGATRPIGDMPWSLGSDDRTLGEAGHFIGTPRLVGLDTSGYVQTIAEGSDADGSAIASFFESGWFAFGDKLRLKRLMRMFVGGPKRNLSLTIEFFTDFSSDATKTYTIDMSGTTEYVFVKQDTENLKFRFLKFKVSNNNANEMYALNDLTLLYELSESIA